VKECVKRLEKEFKAGEQPMDVWQQVKLHYIGLLVDHHQPELAETFFNSVTTKSCTARTSRTTSSLCARRSAPNTSKTTSPRPRPPTAPTTPRADDLLDTLKCRRI
jgi:isocitrate dehydrogenase kinase/phosphatase